MAGFLRGWAEKEGKEVERMLRGEPRWASMYQARVPALLLEQADLAPADREMLAVLISPTKVCQYISDAPSVNAIRERREYVAEGLKRCTVLAVEFGLARFGGGDASD
jgi:hypothetical protein